MDISSLGITGVAAITVICTLVGQAVKATCVNNRFIPVIVGVAGGVLGVLGMLLGVPLTAAIYRLIREDMNKQPKTEPEDPVISQDSQD